MELPTNIKYSLDNEKENPQKILLVHSFLMTKIYIFTIVELSILD